VDAKREFIKAYFDDWSRDLKRVSGLLTNVEHRYDAVLILSCYIGALAALRYPDRSDRNAYINLVIRYSGLKSLYQIVDLLFFYQWPRSEFRRSKDPRARPYSKIQGYSNLKKFLGREFGDENAVLVDSKRRFVGIPTLLRRLPPKFDRVRAVQTLRVFTVSEVLYRYVRCHAVHHRKFDVVKQDGLLRPETILTTVANIVQNLESECLTKGRWPYQLRNMRHS